MIWSWLRKRSALPPEARIPATPPRRLDFGTSVHGLVVINGGWRPAEVQLMDERYNAIGEPVQLTAALTLEVPIGTPVVSVAFANDDALGLTFETARHLLADGNVDAALAALNGVQPSDE